MELGFYDLWSLVIAIVVQNHVHKIYQINFVLTYTILIGKLS